ncbi:MAG: CpsD/CapB family tyrosine-protein kinase [Nitrospirae bacterium]|nr:CpsD/CapB family tyrosine-protein kinase [Nitrospirota bacterium]
MAEQIHINPALRASLESFASGQSYDRKEDSVRGRIVEKPQPDDHLVSLVAPATKEAEQYRTLSLMLEQRRHSGLFQVVAISSPTVGDGKSVTAINLAGAFAQSSEARVLLIDFDFRKPSIPAQLGLKDEQMIGFRDAIANPALSLKDIVHRMPAWNLSFVTVGRAQVMPHEIFKSPRFAELLDEARREFEWIVVDTAPLVLAPDCITIGRSVDGFVMVVSANKTSRSELGEALNILGPSKLVGLVFNNDDRLMTSYKYGPYCLPS